MSTFLPICYGNHRKRVREVRIRGRAALPSLHPSVPPSVPPIHPSTLPAMPQPRVLQHSVRSGTRRQPAPVCTCVCNVKECGRAQWCVNPRAVCKDVSACTEVLVCTQGCACVPAQVCDLVCSWPCRGANVVHVCSSAGCSCTWLCTVLTSVCAWQHCSLHVRVQACVCACSACKCMCMHSCLQVMLAHVCAHPAWRGGCIALFFALLCFVPSCLRHSYLLKEKVAAEAQGQSCGAPSASPHPLSRVTN